ncbi:MAG: acetate--CoA ligase family protein [Sphingomonas sp.]
MVGVSERPGTAGQNCVRMLDALGYGGALHLVARSSLNLGGRVAVTSVEALPEGLDLAILTLPEAGILPAVEALVERKVGGIVCFAAGFAEMGAAGVAAQQRLAELAHRHDIAFAGPNCLGYTNLRDQVAATFLSLPVPTVESGAPRVDILCQSGGLAGVVQMALEAECVGFSYQVTTGNEAVLGVEDYLPFLIENDRSRAIVMLVETLRRPREFLRQAAAARAAGKPIVLLYLGRSEKARAAAATHTGAMAGDFATAQAFLRSGDVVLVDTIDELVDTAVLLAHCPRPPRGGVGIVTDSGGFKGFGIDFCESIGLPIAPIAEATRERLRTSLPKFIEADNPVDVTAQAVFDRSLYATSVDALMRDASVGGVLVTAIAATPEMGLGAATSIASGRVDNGKPLVCAIMAGEKPISPDLKPGLAAQGVAFFRSPERALRAMKRTQLYGEALAKPPRRVSDIVVAAASLPGGAAVLSEIEGKIVLGAAGVPVPAGALVATAAEAEARAAEIGYPVVLKVQAAGLAHKSDIGGVAANLRDPQELRDAWATMQGKLQRAGAALAIEGFLVERMAPRGVEMIVGARRDPIGARR